MELKRGDSDKRQVWGGSKSKTEPAYNVKNLQSDLKSVGVYSDTIDGGYGKNTERALKIYQWCIKNSTKVISNKALVTYSPKPDLNISGKLDTSTDTILKDWISKKYI